MKKAILKISICLLFVFSAQVFAQNNTQTMTEYFDQLVSQDDLLIQDVQWVITNENNSNVSNLQHTYFTQIFNNIEIYGTESSIHTLSNGSMFYSNNRFLLKIADKINGSNNPAITSIGAITAAANQLGYTLTETISVIENETGENRKTLLSNGGISLSDIPAKLVYHLTQDDKLILAWDISIQEINQQNWWNIRVDAATGNILDKNDWMLSCAFDHDHSTHEVLDFNSNLNDIPNYKNDSEEIGGCTTCYEVFAMPIESPYYGARSIETGIEDAVASPFGWHDINGVPGAEYTVTRGNNVNAYEDGNNSGYQPDGGANLDFTGYPFSEIYSNSNQYEDAAITNLFFWNNIIHDVMYTYGFDRAESYFNIQDFEQVIIVPSSFKSFTLNALLFSFFIFHQV